MTDVGRAVAEEMDRADPLASFRERFVIDDEALIYLDGNSLGRLPVATRDRLREVVEHEWGSRLIRSWQERWIDLPQRVGDLLGTGLLGARPGEVVVGDSTTVALYKAMSAALDARPGRDVVVIERGNFPTDRYLVESLARSRDLHVRWVDEAGPDGLLLDHLQPHLDDRVALVVLSHVDYRSAAILDMPALTAAAQAVGALTVWDLCHSVGAVPIDLTGAGAELAVGCTYKYLNAGPGAPAFTYVRRELQPTLSQPIWGWWGRVQMFEMEHGFEPQPDIRAWLSGTPSVLSLTAVEEGAALLAEAGIDRVRRKSTALTGLALRLYDAWLAPVGFRLASPRDPDRLGSHLSVVRADARVLSERLTEAGVVPDYRRPDGIRLGLAPLTTRFVDVYDGMSRLRDLSAEPPTEKKSADCALRNS